MTLPFVVPWIKSRKHLTGFLRLVQLRQPSPLRDRDFLVLLAQIVVVLVTLTIARVDFIVTLIVGLVIVSGHTWQGWQGWIRWVRSMQENHPDLTATAEGLQSAGDGRLVPWTAVGLVENEEVCWLTVHAPLGGVVAAKDAMQPGELERLRTLVGGGT